MKNTKVNLKSAVVAGLILASSLAAVGAGNAQAPKEDLLKFLAENSAPVGDALPMDATDLEIAKSRESSLQQMRRSLYDRDLEIKATDTESVKKLKLLMTKREFTSWFRFTDEVTRNLGKEAKALSAQVKPVMTPQEGFLAKLMMIRQAKYTVDLTYYIFSLDESGYSLVNELRKALRRGVNVRVMVDSSGSAEATWYGNPHFRGLEEDAAKNAGFVTDPATGKKTNLRARLQIMTFNPVSNFAAWVRSRVIETTNAVAKEASGNAENFSPLDTTHWNPNRRSHDKIIVVDAQFPELAIGMTGGRNISNHYYELDPKDHENFKDAEVIVRNDPATARTMDRNLSVGEALNQQYDRLYFHRANWEISRSVNDYIFGHKKDIRKMEKASTRVKEVTQETLKALGEDFDSPEFGKRYLTTGFVNQEFRLVNTANNLVRTISQMAKAVRNSIKVEDYNSIVKNAASAANQQDLLARVVLLADAEQEAITVVSPYLWMGPKDVAFVKAWLRKDPKRTFTVYTNSIVTSDNFTAQLFVDFETARNLLNDPELLSQIKVYEYGRADDVNLGGTKYYGKLHFKGAYFKGLKTSLITTHNKDSRSQTLNSETGFFIQGPEFSANMEREIQDIHQKSHEYGTAEYNEIRSSPHLPWVKAKTVENGPEYLEFIKKHKLWWLI